MQWPASRPNASSSSTLRLRFLRSVRDNIAESATVTSAVLEAEQSRLGLEPDSSLQACPAAGERCPACGFRLGNESSKESTAALIDGDRKGVRRRRHGKTLRPLHALSTRTNQPSVIACSKCHRRVHLQEKLFHSSKTSISSKMSDPAVHTLSTNKAGARSGTAQPEVYKHISNASSKKRARARKKGDLQTLLLERNPEFSPRANLDLMDFLTTS